MTNERLAELEALEKKATPLDNAHFVRYEHGGARLYVEDSTACNRELIADFYDEGNREFYFASRTAIPELIAALREAQAQVSELFTRLKTFDRLFQKWAHTPSEQEINDAIKATEQVTALEARVKALLAAGEKLKVAIADGEYYDDTVLAAWDSAVTGS